MQVSEMNIEQLSDVIRSSHRKIRSAQKAMRTMKPGSKMFKRYEETIETRRGMIAIADAQLQELR